MFGKLNKICIFVTTNHFRRNSKINIYDKSVPTVRSSERVVLPFLKWLVTPKGTLAYKFFKMTNKKKFVNVRTYAAFTTLAKGYKHIVSENYETLTLFRQAQLTSLQLQFKLLQLTTLNTSKR